MARYVADQNQVTFKFESGTYAVVSGGEHWIGAVQSNDIDDEMGVIPLRYAGTATRNVDQFIDGPQDVTGTLTFFPQDWKFLHFALGSNVDGGSPSPYTHTISETNTDNGNAFTSGTLNPFVSFTVVDSQSKGTAGENFVRTVNGCVVDSLTMTAAQGEIINMEVGFRGQSSNYSSGAIAAITDTATTRPFLWSDVEVHKPSGTVLPTVKEVSVTVNNNFEAPHYLNGSRVVSTPFPQSRDYEISLTVDSTSEKTKEFYDQNLIGGSEFNMIFAVNASTGSRAMAWTFSGCKLMDMESPSEVEGVNEQTLTIAAKTSVVLVDDAIELYNPW